MYLAGGMLASRFRIPHRLDGEQWRLGLHIMDVLRIIDSGVPHCVFDSGSNLLDHRQAADIFRKQYRTHRGAHCEPRFRYWSALVVARKDRCMWRDDAVAAAGPHHRNLVDCALIALAMLEQYATERLVGENSGEVVDPAIPLGFANNANDFVRPEYAAGDARFEARRVGDRLQFDFENFYGHLLPGFWLPCVVGSGVPPGPDSAQFVDF